MRPQSCATSRPDLQNSGTSRSSSTLPHKGELVAHLFKGLERIEEAREQLTGRSFMAGLFVGRPDFSLLLPPEESPKQKAAWEEYRPRLETFLKTHVDPDEIERTAKIPDSVLKGLFALGAFGMKIPKEYGGLGFSYTNYGRALMLIASWSNILALDRKSTRLNSSHQLSSYA